MTSAAGRPSALVLRGGGLGDVLTAVPAIRTIRAGLPDHRLILGGPPPIGALLRTCGLVDDVVAVATTRLRPAWDEEPPDIAVNLHGCGPESHRALQQLRPRRLVAFGCAAAGHVGPPWHVASEPEPQRDRWVRLAATLPAGPRRDHTLSLADRPGAADHSGGAGPLVVHPGAASAARRWPAERYALVAAALAGAGADVVVTGSLPERRVVADVVRLAGAGVRPRVGADLLAFARFLATASLVVCGDTGVGHLAAALRRPSVHIMGPSHPREWGPPPGPHEVLWAGRTGDPHADVVDAGLLEVGVTDVLDAVARRWDGEASRRRRVPA